MWLLSCDGDLFGGKRIWLAPGSTHLFGRTTSKSEHGERIKYIENRSVSRKHLLITVHPVASGSSLKIHERTKIEVKDGSKIGTYVNEKKIVGTSEVLDGIDYTFRLGNYEHALRLTWQPAVFCYSGGSKSKDHFAQSRPVLEPAGVKLLKDYVSNKTTHSVSKKRNTAQNLQALVQGKWVVNEGWVEALCKAVKAGPGEDGASALEEDFDRNWPIERNFVPPPGSEPVLREEEYYLPKPERGEIFSGFVFLFMYQGQYDNLLSVITSGSGKALLWEIEIGESKVEDLIEYVKQAAGHKGSGDFRLTQNTGPGGIVLVQPVSEEGSDIRRFIRPVESSVGQRAIEQRELLDVVLTLDTSTLRQPFAEPPQALSPPAERDVSPTPAQRSQRRSQQAVSVHDSPPAHDERPRNAEPPAQNNEPAQQDETPAEAPPRRQRRYITQSRFKDFDDDFDPSQFSKPAAVSPEPSHDREPSQAPDAEEMDVDQSVEAPQTQPNPRKRAADQDKLDEDAMYKGMLTGQAALKRRKTELAARTGIREASVADSVVAEKVAAYQAAERKKKAKKLDVIGEIQKRREKDEEERRKDQETLREAMEGVDLKTLTNLAQVEEMEMPVRQRPSRDAEDGRHGRWDERWNGRKNFKKFRPQGSSEVGPRLNRVIVSLEEVPRKSQGIGDEYWLQPTRSSKKKSQSQSQASRRARSQRSEDTENAGDGDHGEQEDPTKFRRRLEASRLEDEEEARSEATFAEEIAGGRSRDQQLLRAAAKSATQARMNATPSQTMRGNSQRKRPAGSGAASATAPPAKRGRVEREREVVELEDDDDDELKFRRRRRN